MKLSQKKTCSGCRSELGLRGDLCEAGFKRRYKSKDVMGFPISNYTPTEPCYKPRTLDEWEEAINIASKNRNA